MDNQSILNHCKKTHGVHSSLLEGVKSNGEAYYNELENLNNTNPEINDLLELRWKNIKKEHRSDQSDILIFYQELKDKYIANRDRILDMMIKCNAISFDAGILSFASIEYKSDLRDYEREADFNKSVPIPHFE